MKEDFKNKKILILGFARSGYEVAKLLINRNNTVYLNDNKTEDKQDKAQVKELTDLGVNLIFGSHPDDLLDSSFDYLIKNPGVPIDHKYVLKAKELGIPVLNEVEVSFHLLPENTSIIGITGTNGKTTTTSLTYDIMKKAYNDKVHLAGNIGYPVSSIVNKVKENDIIVLECSCQQGENFIDFHPHIGVFTNLSPAHIDFMKTYEHYKNTKSKMFYNQSENDIAIINYNDKEVLEELKNIKSIKKYFSSTDSNTLCHLKDNYIYYDNEKIINIDDIKIKGMHNIENVMCAISVVKEYNVSNDIIKEVVSNFKGVEHRLEYVDTVNNVEYYNDTEATNIKCTQIALSSFNKPIIIFLGGLDRGQDFNELTPYMDNVKTIIGIGQCRNRVEEYAKSINKEYFIFEYLKDGFNKLKDIVKEHDVVLLSPASASWDQYKECEVRGQEFKDLVKQLNK